MVRSRFRGLIALSLSVALAACGTRDNGDRNLDTLDNELVDAGNGAGARDPAMMSALHDRSWSTRR